MKSRPRSPLDAGPLSRRREAEAVTRRRRPSLCAPDSNTCSVSVTARTTQLDVTAPQRRGGIFARIYGFVRMCYKNENRDPLHGRASRDPAPRSCNSFCLYSCRSPSWLVRRRVTGSGRQYSTRLEHQHGHGLDTSTLDTRLCSLVSALSRRPRPLRTARDA